MFRELKRYQLVTDVAVAAAFLVLPFLVLLTGESGWLAVLVHLVFAVSLALRRLSPGLALCIAWLAAIGQMATGLQSPSVSDLAALAVLYATAAYGSRAIRWIGLASAAVGALVAAAYLLVSSSLFGAPWHDVVLRGSGSASDISRVVVLSLFVLFGCIAVLGLSWTLGLLASAVGRARASRRAQELAEQDVAVEQERTRIARDMHDVVAHSLAVVIAQADGARYARQSDPAVVDDALTAISTTARAALGDVRILLSQLRHSQGEAPQPLLADLDRLIEQLRASGLRVRRVEHGTAVTLATGQQLAIYRIVQEALTNALRHGDTGGEVELRFDWSPGAVMLVVTSRLSEETHPAEGPLGHGLAGMRERALLVGGSLTAEATPQDTWVVRASLPVDALSGSGAR